MPMESVVNHGSALNGTPRLRSARRTLARWSAAVRDAMDGIGVSPRAVGYAVGCTLCAIGLIGHFVTADGRAQRDAPAAAARTSAVADRPAVVAERDLPEAPQPSALIDRTARPDLATVRMAAAKAAAERAAAASESAAAEGASGEMPPRGGPGRLAALPGAAADGGLDAGRMIIRRTTRTTGPINARAAHDEPSLTGVPARAPAGEHALADARGILASTARPRGEAAACATCDCTELTNKRLFTLEPLRQEEQAWYRASCPQ